MDGQLTGAQGLLIICAVILAIGYFIAHMRAAGIEKYNVSFYMSFPFLLLVSVCLYAFVMLISSMDSSGHMALSDTDTTTVEWAASGAYLVSTLINVKRTSVVFGIVYTIAQAIMACFFFLLVLGIFHWLRSKKSTYIA